MTIDSASEMRRAATFSGAGLAVQFGAAFHWTPLTFVLSAVIGLPLVGIGSVLVLRAVVRIMRNRGVL